MGLLKARRRYWVDSTYGGSLRRGTLGGAESARGPRSCPAQHGDFDASGLST